MLKAILVTVVVLVVNVCSIEIAIDDLKVSSTNSTEKRVCSTFFETALNVHAQANKKLAKALCDEIKAYMNVVKSIDTYCDEKNVMASGLMKGLEKQVCWIDFGPTHIGGLPHINLPPVTTPVLTAPTTPEVTDPSPVLPVAPAVVPVVAEPDSNDGAAVANAKEEASEKQTEAVQETAEAKEEAVEAAQAQGEAAAAGTTETAVKAAKEQQEAQEAAEEAGEAVAEAKQAADEVVQAEAEEDAGQAAPEPVVVDSSEVTGSDPIVVPGEDAGQLDNVVPQPF